MKNAYLQNIKNDLSLYFMSDKDAITEAVKVLAEHHNNGFLDTNKAAELATVFQLRDYQQNAVDAVMNHITKATTPCLVEAATGAGKSLIIAELARLILDKAQHKKVLCFAPALELVVQNHQKYSLIAPASIYCASAGEKCLKNQVIFCSPQTVKNGLEQILKHEIVAIILDEAHNLTPTIKAIFEQIKAKNPNVRIIGLTATPYRIGTGYIYELTDTEIVEETINPYFKKLVYSVKAEYLIDKGYLTPPTVPSEQSESYHAKDLQLDKKGNFNADDIERVFGSDDALTRKIVFDVVSKSADRTAVIVFATTIKHAERILQYLGEADTGNKAVLITGETPKRTREQYLKEFKAGKIKYAVNVATLTTGVDVTAIDVVAILRPTESAGLLQQIIGRGLRLHEGKHDCLILDYAENIERHKLQGNLFAPEIVTAKGGEKGGAKFLVECPACKFNNRFPITAKPIKNVTAKMVFNYAIPHLKSSGLQVDDDVYKYNGDVKASYMGYITHSGQRCQNMLPVKPFPKDKTDFMQCTHRFNSKVCPECDADNALSARMCHKCGCELINPDDKLVLKASKFKSQFRTIKILNHAVGQPYVARSGNPTVRVDFETTEGVMAKFYSPESEHIWKIKEYREIKELTPTALKIKEGDDGKIEIKKVIF